MVVRSTLKLLLLASICSGATTARAGGWTQEPGRFYLKLWDRSLIRGSNAYVGDTLGHSESVPEYSDHQLNLYGEVGVHERVTIVGAFTPFGYAKIGGESASYVGPLTVGARFGLLRGSTPLAVEVHYGYAPPVGDDPLYDVMQTGTDGIDRRIVYAPTVENHRFELQLQMGHGFRIRETGAWFTASLGARANTDYRSALTAFAQVGVQPWRFTFDLHVGVYEPFGGEIVLTNVSGAGNTRYLGVGIGIAFAITDHIGLTFGAEGVLYASSNAATPAYLFGIEAKR